MDEDIKSVHITEVLTSSKIVELIDKYPNLNEITCAPSVYERTSDTYIAALGELDIEVRKKYNWGAKSKSNNQENEILKLSNEGLTAKEISQKLDLKLNRVYYLLRKANGKFNNYKKKHNHEEVQKLHEDGLTASEIAEKLNIPQRSVYYILNNK